jgi:hypothetical protein
MPLTDVQNDEATILARVIRPDGDLSPTAARAILKLGFAPDDRQRMHDLVSKNQDDSLTAAETRELESYRRVGRLLDLLAARARRSLSRRVRK